MTHNCDNCKCNNKSKESDEQILKRLKTYRNDIDNLIEEFELRVAEKEKDALIQEVTQDLDEQMKLLKYFKERGYPYDYYMPSQYTRKVTYPMWFRM